MRRFFIPTHCVNELGRIIREKKDELPKLLSITMGSRCSPPFLSIGIYRPCPTQSVDKSRESHTVLASIPREDGGQNLNLKLYGGTPSEREKSSRGLLSPGRLI